jgi:hypothetical protein
MAGKDGGLSKSDEAAQFAIEDFALLNRSRFDKPIDYGK